MAIGNRFPLMVTTMVRVIQAKMTISIGLIITTTIDAKFKNVSAHVTTTTTTIAIIIIAIHHYYPYVIPHPLLIAINSPSVSRQSTTALHNTPTIYHPLLYHSPLSTKSLPILSPHSPTSPTTYQMPHSNQGLVLFY